MVDGGDNIVEVSWESVSSILQVVSVRVGVRSKLSLIKQQTKILDLRKQL